MTKEDVLPILRAVAGEAGLKYKATIRGLFGSFAKGEESLHSDVDVLVDFSENADLFDFVGLSLFLEEKLHAKVDIVPADTIKPEIRQTILEETIYL
jgi:predicted nucleotidyltransferase